MLAPVWGQQYDDENYQEPAVEEPLADLEQKQAPADSLLNSKYLQSIMSDNIKQLLMDYIKENPFSKMSEAEVKSFIMNQSKGRPVEKYIQNFPKVFDFFVDWLRDPKAIPAFISIVNRPKVVKNYGIAVLVVFILSFALNLLNTKGNLFVRIGKKLIIMLSAFTVNLALFYVFFKPEISPTIDVVKRSIF